MLGKLLRKLGRTVRIVIGGSLAIYVVAFDPPIVEICGFVGCSPVYSPAHWTSVVLFLIAFPLLFAEFVAIVRSQKAESIRAFEHELATPHPGVEPTMFITVGGISYFNFYSDGPSFFVSAPGGEFCLN